MTTKFLPRALPLYGEPIYVGAEKWDGIEFTNHLEVGEELSGTPVFTPETAAVEVVAGTPAIMTREQTNDTATALLRAVSAINRIKIWVECDTTTGQHLVRYIEWEIRTGPPA